MSNVTIRIDQRNDYGVGESPNVYARISLLDQLGRTVGGKVRHELVPLSPRSSDAVELDLEPGTYSLEARLPSGELLAELVTVKRGGDNRVVLKAESATYKWLSWQILSGNVGFGRNIFQRGSSDSTGARGAEKPPAARRAAKKVAKRSGSFSDSANSSSSDRSTEARSPLVSGRAINSYPSIGSLPSIPNLQEGHKAHARLSRDLIESIGLHVSNGRVQSSVKHKAPSAWAIDEPAKVTASRAIHWLELDSALSEREFLRSNPWVALPALSGATENIIAGLKADSSSHVIAASASNESVAVFEIPGGDTPFLAAPRSFAAVRRRMGVELICLPTPWGKLRNGQPADIEVGVRVPRYEHEFASSVAVRDDQLAVLLGYLSSGDLSAVNRLVEQSQIMVLEKNSNPLAAAAGGYALVGSAIDASAKSWHRWIENLMARFELPDGAIQYGMMRLRLRTSRSDVLSAARAFKLAYTRGLPIYGMGVRWLLEGLERTASADPEAKDMAVAVRRLSSRLHPQSPFTIFRLGKR